MIPARELHTDNAPVLPSAPGAPRTLHRAVALLPDEDRWWWEDNISDVAGAVETAAQAGGRLGDEAVIVGAMAVEGARWTRSDHAVLRRVGSLAVGFAVACGVVRKGLDASVGAGYRQGER